MRFTLNRFGFSILFLILISVSVEAKEVTIRIGLTGDMHSHFTGQSAWGGEDNEFFKRGDFARLKTALDREREKAAAERKTFLTFDAGDWSEGSIFYTDGVGQSSLTALRLLGYDAVVLGNHDWFSGPFALHSVIESVNASFPILAANLADSGATPRDRILQSLSQYRDTAEKETGEKLNLPMDLPDFAAFLVQEGIESMSLNPDSVIQTIEQVAELEEKLSQ